MLKRITERIFSTGAASADLAISGILGKTFRKLDEGNQWASLYEEIEVESASENRKFTTIAAELVENEYLNRFCNVLPYDHTAVKLSNGDYINASHVVLKEYGRHFILCQGPIPDTVIHFWQMIWEQNVKCIVMLNKVYEKNQYKCNYFPGSDRSVGKVKMQYGEYWVHLESEYRESNFVKRTFLLKNKESVCREISHFQFTTWPDFGVPDKTEDFLRFLLKIRESGFLNLNKGGPVVCHCVAGIGRSGTFVVADAALVCAYKTKDSSQVDIKRILIEGRRCRMGLIQTPEQLRFAWKCVVEALEKERWKLLVENSCFDEENCEIIRTSPMKRPATASYEDTCLRIGSDVSLKRPKSDVILTETEEATKVVSEASNVGEEKEDSVNEKK